MKYEAQQMFLALDDLLEATKYMEPPNAEASYVRLAIAYDRFLKVNQARQLIGFTSTPFLLSSFF